MADYEERKYYDTQSLFGGGFYPRVDSSDYCKPILEPIAEYEVVSLSPEDTFNYVDITFLDFQVTLILSQVLFNCGWHMWGMKDARIPSLSPIVALT